MKLYGKKINLASMRGISWHVVVFSGKKEVFANSLSAPLAYLQHFKIYNLKKYFPSLQILIKILPMVRVLSSKT